MRDFDASRVPNPGISITIPKGYKALDIEIGCGVGFHPIDYAKNHSDRFLVAIERTKEKFSKFQGRLKNHPHLVNVVGVHSDAVWWITHNIKAQSVDRYFILYPNPYPKDEQKRFFQMPFMTFLVSTLKAGGTITLATNEKHYYEEAKTNGPKIWGLRIFEDRILDSKEQPRSHFEKKYLERKENCYHLVLQKPK